MGQNCYLSMKSKNILIVDDNDLNRKLFENLVGQIWSYQTATDGLEAIQKVKEDKFDLILMDIQMPKLDGISALKQIKASELATCPIIAVTAFADESDRMAFLDQGFDEFITKPIRPREFLEKIQHFLEINQEKNSKSSGNLNVKDVILDMDIFRQLGKYNNPQMIKKVYLDFIEESNGILNKIPAELERDNFRVISESLHILKGNSGTLGINKVYIEAQKAELLAKEGDKSNLLSQHEKIQKEIESFLKYLNEATIFES